MYSKIQITDSAQTATIDIEGIIGVPESVQEDDECEQVTTYARLKEAIGQIKELGAQELVVNIRSTGGDVNDALLIFDAIKTLGCRITTRCYGYAASAATIIAQAASEGAREISANSLYLIHCCESACEGNSQSLGITKELLDKSDRRIASIYAERSGRNADDFLALMNENGGKGRWLTPEEVVGRGLADRVIASSPIENYAAEQIRLLGLPPVPQIGHKSSWRLRITDRWKRVLELLGLKHDGVLTEQGMDIIDKALEQSAIKSDCMSRTRTLEDRIIELTSGDRQSEAKPTATKQKEDPSADEYTRKGNQLAYDSDLKRMLNRN